MWKIVFATRRTMRWSEEQEKLILRFSHGPFWVTRRHQEKKNPRTGIFLSWGSGIRTPISTSRAWRAAVAPIPKTACILPLVNWFCGSYFRPLWHCPSLHVFVPWQSQAGTAHLRAARRVLSSISRKINSPLETACKPKK